MLLIGVRSSVGAGARATAVAAVLCPAPSTASTSGSIVAHRQSRGIKSLATQSFSPLPIKPEPWPYKEVGYNRTHMWYDMTFKRFDENTKIIVVEGNIGSGKSTAAKELAEKLGFYYIPEFDIEEILIKGNGKDLRSIYKYVPPKMRIPDLKQMYEDPYSWNTALFQTHMLWGRFEQYCNAMAHLLNTGQGVVLDRSVFSDFAFVNAGRLKRFISPNYFRAYFWFRRLLLPAGFMGYWPHVFIYIDNPIDKCLENIKKRGKSFELNTYLDREYLQVIEDSYRDMLNEVKRHSKVVVYDWSKNPDVDRVIEDLEKMELDFFEWHSTQVLENWHKFRALGDRHNWNYPRKYFTLKHQPLQYFMEFNRLEDVPEFRTDFGDKVQYRSAVAKFIYDQGYAPGFHPSEFKKNWADIIFFNRNWRYEHVKQWFDYYWKDAWYGNENRLQDLGDFTGDHWFHDHFVEAFHTRH